MKNIIGIRLENKNKWERRTPIIPKHMKELIQEETLEFIVQSSPIRAFKDQEFQDIGARISSDISKPNVVFSIKEIPIPIIEAQSTPKTYVFFSHTIKGQKHNMPMLKKLLDMQ